MGKLFFNNSSSFSYAFPVSTVTNTVTQVDVVADTNNVSDDDDNDYVLEDDNDADDEDCSILLSMPMDVDVGVDVDDYDYDYDYVDIELYGNRSHNHSLPLLSSSSSSSSLSLPFSITKSVTTTRPASIIKKKKNNNNNNKSRVISVRFDTKWINLSHDKTNMTRRRRIKKSKRSRAESAAVDSKLWYTRKEIKENHKSIIKAAKCNEKRKADLMPLPSSFSSSSYSCSLPRDDETQQQEEKDIEIEVEDIHILNWFSSKQRQQRSNIRTQMNEIVKAVKEFENATHTHVPNLLSELLQKKSNSQQIKRRSQNSKSKLMILG